MRVEGYGEGQLLWQNQGEAVYTALRLEDGLPVTAKVYERALCEQAQGRLEYEYAALREPGTDALVAALALVDGDEQRALIFGRPTGAPLLDAIRAPVELPQLLDFGCQAASALAALHRRRLTHRHLRPRAFTFDAQTGRVTLTDLGFSLGQDRAARDLSRPMVLHESLPYASPEQTGRTARSFDGRSDLYSLGVVLYELASGCAPFSGGDALELIHAHLAQTPVSLVEHRRELPSVVSALVERLLSKDPAERYQTAAGLLADLERARQGLEQGKVYAFELGAQDFPDSLELTERLYGRELEEARLVAAVEAATRGQRSTVLIAGLPGIGKTALVQSVRPALVARAGHFATGKFAQGRQGTPFVALAQAVSGLVDTLVAEGDHELPRWRQRLLDTLGGLGSLLFEFAPRLRGLLGEQPSLPEVGSLEASERTQQALVRFFCALSSAEHPLLLFLDDLQWSDPGSLQVWERLASDDRIVGLVLVLAYRSHEVGAEHPLLRSVERLEQSGQRLSLMQLDAISADAAAEMLMDVLHVDERRAQSLNRRLAGRTEHNPLVIRRLLQLMAERGVLVREGRTWTWSDELLSSVGLPAGVMDVIHTKLEALAPEPRAALSAASCLGDHFDVESLAAALGSDPVTTFRHLAALLEQGLLVESEGSYRFEHDGVLEAAALRLGPAERDVYHLRAGRFQRERAEGASLESQVFAIVGHLNRGLEREHDARQLADLARLNLLAGTKGVRAAAYADARGYLQTGLVALGKASGRPSSDECALRGSLQLELARATALGGDYAGANRIFDELLAQALPKLQLAEICVCRVEVSLAVGEFEDAVRWGLRGLAHTGLDLPRYPSKPSLVRAMLRGGWLGRGDIGRRVRELPRCEQPEICVRIELLSIMSIAVIRLGGELVPMAFLAGASETFRSGTTPAAPHVLTAFGTLLVSVFGQLKAAADLADEALILAAAPNTRHRSKVLLASHSMLLPWTRPFETCVEELGDVYAAALREGDVVFAGYGLVFVANCHMAMGVPLAELGRSAGRADRYLAGTATADVRAGQQTLLGIVGWLTRSSERSIDVDDPFRVLDNADPSVRAPSVVFSSALHCIAGQPERALRLLETIEASAEMTLLAVAERAEYFFWRGLAAGMAALPLGWKQSAHKPRLARARRSYRRWAKLCPENFGAKALLLDAEWARLGNAPRKAARLYRRAADVAAQHGRMQVAALARERLLRTSAGTERQRRLFARQAIEAYAAWGAERKVSLLTEEFRDCLMERPAPDSVVTDERSATSSPGHVDLLSVLKTTRAITAAPDYASVVERLMAGLVENAGAERAVLVMQGDAGWALEVAYGAEGPEAGVSAVPLESARELLPVSLLRRVERERAPVIYDDALSNAEGASDPYFTRRRVRAAMCIPIELQSRCMGAIYLENKLSPGVFTRERIDLVVALAAQAAISLTNARLLGALRTSEAEWRSLVDHAPDLIMIVDRTRSVTFLNHAPEGVAARDLRGQDVESFMSALGRTPLRDAIEQVFTRGGHVMCDTEYVDDAGRRHLLVTRISPIAVQGDVSRVTLLSTDVSEQRALEERLRQTQKMEAIGTLAGGVAHDFNNLLSVIVGSCEVGLRAALGGADQRSRFEAILAATGRANSLTRQLLTFSRKDSSELEALAVNQVVEHSCNMLERLLGDDVQIERQLAPGIGRVHMNRCQLEQVLLNLSINARDAMPSGGTLRLRTWQLSIEPGATEAPLSLPEGRYACLSVSDTGAGMDEATRQRAFEPFFTTKELGRGTGLGLATVHGIVRAAEGHINVKSTLGQGSTFEVFLPVTEHAPATPVTASTEAHDRLPRGSETILLVEDNHEVRELTAAMLEGQGYRVVSEASAALALANTGAIAAAQLLVTDVLMPGLQGPELARLARLVKPGLRILYISGRGFDGVGGAAAPAEPHWLLHKPYSTAQLAHMVRAALDAS